MNIAVKSVMAFTLMAAPMAGWAKVPAKPAAKTATYAQAMQCWRADYQYRSALISGGGDIPDDNDWLAEMADRYTAAAKKEGISPAKVSADEQLVMADDPAAPQEGPAVLAKCKRDFGWHTGHKR